jgi:anti-anti-sigma regulatory factor
MLIITEVSEDDKTVTLRLEGKIVNEWLLVLERACLYHSDNKNKTVLLDFSDVTFISDDGVKMLENIKNGRVKVTNCSPFIRSILPSLLTENTDIKGEEDEKD